MAVSYKKLWKLLIDKDMSKAQLARLAGISNGTLTNMTRGEYIALSKVEAICRVMSCTPSDMMEFMPEVVEGDGSK